MTDIVERALRQAASSGVALYEEAAAEITRLRTELAAALERESRNYQVGKLAQELFASTSAELAVVSDGSALLPRCENMAKVVFAELERQVRDGGLVAYIPHSDEPHTAVVDGDFDLLALSRAIFESLPDGCFERAPT